MAVYVPCSRAYCPVCFPSIAYILSFRLYISILYLTKSSVWTILFYERRCCIHHVSKDPILLYRHAVPQLCGFHKRQAAGSRTKFRAFVFIVYIGKKPNCTPSELTKALSLDWGHSQRCINRLTDDGFITKEKSGRHYLLNLTERGQEAFEAAHRIFFDWDDRFMTNLTAKEKEQLLALLEKATERIPHHVRND